MASSGRVGGVIRYRSRYSSSLQTVAGSRLVGGGGALNGSPSFINKIHTHLYTEESSSCCKRVFVVVVVFF